MLPWVPRSNPSLCGPSSLHLGSVINDLCGTNFSFSCLVTDIHFPGTIQHVMVLTSQLYMTAPTLTPQTATACRVPKMGKLFLLREIMRKATMKLKGTVSTTCFSLGFQRCTLPPCVEAASARKTRIMHRWENLCTGRTLSKERQCLWLSLWIITFACWGRYIQMC